MVLRGDGRTGGTDPTLADPGRDGRPVANLTVMPGGIDTHVHLASYFDDDGRVHRARDDSEEPREKLALYVAENA